MENEQNKIRYEMRNKIENIIKFKNIDRNKFHEVSKLDWQGIIKKLYYSFCDYQTARDSYMWKEPLQKDWHAPYDRHNVYGWRPYMWTSFRKDLIIADRVYEGEWDEYIEKLFSIVPAWNDKTFYFLITDGGWVYEGTLPMIVNILFDYPIGMMEFYLFPKDYSWVITHSEDAECMWRTGCRSQSVNSDLCE